MWLTPKIQGHILNIKDANIKIKENLNSSFSDYGNYCLEEDA